MRRLQRWHRLSAAILLVVGVGAFSVCGAQLPPDLADRIRSNQRDLIRHAWTMRMEIENAGQDLGSTTERVRFGSEGYVEREMLSDEREKGARQPEMEGLIERVISTLVPYAFPNPEAAAKFLTGGEVTEDNEQLRIRGAGFLAEDDTMDLVAGEDPLRALSLSVVCLLEDLPLRVKAEYRQIEDGLNVIARITADYKDMRLTIVNTDYEKFR